MSLDGVAFKDLESKGFLVIRSFLSEEEIEFVRADYGNQPLADNKNYGVKFASPDANLRLLVRVKEVLAKVTAETDLHVNRPQGATYFATGRTAGVNFSWHQDHESFFELQNHYDYLNFYIPVVKPLPDKSNLSIVPFDVLEQQSPRIYRALVRGGATRFVQLRKTPLLICDDSGRVHRIPIDIDTLAHTPSLKAGDLLLLRGDVIHRTQDAETERVAISFRVTNSQGRVNRSRLASGGLKKAIMMANNSAHYERMFKAFNQAGKDEMTVLELGQAMARVPAGPMRRQREFLRLLIGEKLRSHVLSSFVVNVATTYVLDMMKHASKLYPRSAGETR